MPPSSLALMLAEYCAGIVAWKTTSISGCWALNAGIILSFQASASSFLHDSMITVPAKIGKAVKVTITKVLLKSAHIIIVIIIVLMLG